MAKQLSKNAQIAKEFNHLLTAKYGVEVSCNYQDNFVLFGLVAQVQRAVADLVKCGLTALSNEIPDAKNPYNNGYMTAIVGKV